MDSKGLNDVCVPCIHGTCHYGFDVNVSVHHAYDVEIVVGLLPRYGPMFVNAFGRPTTVVLTDTRVRRLYGGELHQTFRSVGIEPAWLVVPEGESSKSLETFGRLLEQMAEIGVDRRAVLVNFGGGVISDLGGFLASAFLRGIRYANFSTSLLGQLDAAVGGKVAVNTRVSKNFVGAFYHPHHVAADPDMLRSLSERDFRSGLAEAIKVGIIASPDLFSYLEQEQTAIRRRESSALVHVIGEAARLKMAIISRDPYENDLRRPLNFGHTIGHPIETEFGYRGIRHGEAVAVGMGVATTIARQKELLSVADADRIYRLLKAYGLLGFSEPIRPDGVLGHMRYVRLVRGRHLHFVLPRAIGAVEITDELSRSDLVHGFEAFNEVVRWNRG